METNFHNTNFTLMPAFIMRFKATRKWPIEMAGFHDDFNLQLVMVIYAAGITFHGSIVLLNMGPPC